MKIKIELELDGTNRDVSVLKAITQALTAVPPEGLEISTGQPEPSPITVWTGPDKVEEALESINVAPDAGPVKVEIVEAATPTVDLTPEETKARGKLLRQRVLDVSNLEGCTLDTAREVINKTLGVKSIKDVTPTDAPKAIEALETFIREKKA